MHFVDGSLVKGVCRRFIPGNCPIEDKEPQFLEKALCSAPIDTSLLGLGPNQAYRRSASNSIVIGAHLAKLASQFDAGTFHCIGHSLGGQVCGFFGKRFQRLDSIIALDPAGPIFSSNGDKNKLSKSDAKHVQVIHTNGKMFG